MKVLIVGGGAREHAIAAKLKDEDSSLDLVAAPGNPGIAELARCVPVGATDIAALLDLAERERAELTVVGPEGPLEGGIVDRFTEAGMRIFGPTSAGARIETSKRFAKQLMTEAGVPTARAEIHREAVSAKKALDQFGLPVVIKASGLAAGKGVIVAQTRAEAERAIDAMLSERIFGAAGHEILLEEFMEGEELSLFGITDGTHVIPLLGAQDHKRLLDGDAGPNTGGMGAYAPASLATPNLIDEISGRIFIPTIDALRRSGSEFRGLLYAGLMLTDDGPKVVEFNCRFGDPETEAILPLMTSSLLELFTRVANRESLKNVPAPTWSPMTAVTTVVAAAGYPDSPQNGDEIRLPEVPENVRVFHAGTEKRDGTLVTSGGRVLAVTALGKSVAEAGKASRDYCESVTFRGKQFRRDIGWRELARRA